MGMQPTSRCGIQLTRERALLASVAGRITAPQRCPRAEPRCLSIAFHDNRGCADVEAHRAGRWEVTLDCLLGLMPALRGGGALQEGAEGPSQGAWKDTTCWPGG